MQRTVRHFVGMNAFGFSVGEVCGTVGDAPLNEVYENLELVSIRKYVDLAHGFLPLLRPYYHSQWVESSTFLSFDFTYGLAIGTGYLAAFSFEAFYGNVNESAKQDT